MTTVNIWLIKQPNLALQTALMQKWKLEKWKHVWRIEHKRPEQKKENYWTQMIYTLPLL